MAKSVLVALKVAAVPATAVVKIKQIRKSENSVDDLSALFFYVTYF